MCELLGISFNNPVRPIFSFPGLIQGSQSNRDGWGIGYYPEGSKLAQVFKEPSTGATSELVAFLQNYQGLRADVFIGHIRKASRGENVHSNTHPFTRYYSNREWMFCHNGTLPKLKTLPKQTYVPIGNTDSEHAFCILLNSMKKKHIKSATRNRYNGFTDSDIDLIYQALVEINGIGAGSFNCIFTDGIYLFCYRDQNARRQLSYLHRKHPFHKTRLRGDDVEIDLQVMKSENDRGYIVASKPLSNENWISFKPRELMVLSQGQIFARRR